MRAGRAFLVAAVLAGVMASGGGLAGATTSTPGHVAITGQGSTLAALAFTTWTEKAQDQGLNVNYTATSSPAGLSAYAAGTATFAASEAEFSELYPTTPDYLSRIPRGFAYAPDVGSAVALMYHVALTSAGKVAVTDLHLSPLTVARIFMHIITTWTSPTISQDNEGFVLPHEPITLDLRSGQSGTTALFYDFVKHATRPSTRPGQQLTSSRPRRACLGCRDNPSGFGKGPGFDPSRARTSRRRASPPRRVSGRSATTSSATPSSTTTTWLGWRTRRGTGSSRTPRTSMQLCSRPRWRRIPRRHWRASMTARHRWPTRCRSIRT